MKLNDFHGNLNGAIGFFWFKRAIQRADFEVFKIMEKVESANSDFEEDEMNQFAENGDVSRELYDLMCTVVNEATTVVRSEDGSVHGTSSTFKYNPKPWHEPYQSSSWGRCRAREGQERERGGGDDDEVDLQDQDAEELIRRRLA